MAHFREFVLRNWMCEKCGVEQDGSATLYVHLIAIEL